MVRRPPSITMELLTFPSEFALAKTTSPLDMVIGPVKVLVALVKFVLPLPVAPWVVAVNVIPPDPVFETTPE